MKDKLKGLVVGLTLGTLVTGSLAYATNSTSIDVYFRQLKYMVEGVEKPMGDSQGFIYQDTAYVPVRYVSQALGKEVNFDNDTGTVWIGKNYGGDGRQQVAAYQGGAVTKVEFDSYVAANSFYNGRMLGGSQESQLRGYIAMKLLAAQAGDAYDADAAQSVEAQWAQVVQYFGSPDVALAQMKRLNVNEYDLRQYLTLQFKENAVLKAKVDDAMLKTQYDTQRAADPAAFVTASVRHILIATQASTAGGTTRTDEEALARAKEVEAKLAAGGDFAALAKEYSDDPGSKDNGGLYADADLQGYIEEFKAASATQEIGKVGEPVKTAYGYHIIKVESRKVKTLDEVKDSLRQQLVNTVYQQFVAAELPGLIESITLPQPSPAPDAAPQE